ncbi:hypothetical protein [uncultured Sulfitobacter sp.]|uniref:hypothetical protein n=1 Tax=uncultured Sulfitobacter sp. TaxID=191468 RepID=UPI0026174A61|nr:hypothetical protein [uncultured Sulfitobacter sp.]
MATLFDSLGDDERLDEEEESQVLKSPDDEFNASSSSSLLVSVEIADAGELSGAGSVEQVEATPSDVQAAEEASQTVYFEELTNINSFQQNANVLTLNLTSAGVSDSTAPLDDFNSNPNTPIFSMDEIDHISIDVEEEDGHVEVLRANYYERLGNSNGGNLENLRTGANFYFIPHGENFPEDYVWSEESASLYNEQTYTNVSADFGNIRLILRVDTGSIFDANLVDDERFILDEKFDNLQELIIDNRNTREI